MVYENGTEIVLDDSTNSHDATVLASGEIFTFYVFKQSKNQNSTWKSFTNHTGGFECLYEYTFG